MSTSEHSGHRPHWRALALVILGACSGERDPMGTRGRTFTTTQAPSGAIYSEERPFVDLSARIPAFAGYSIDADGTIVLYLTSLDGAEEAKRAIQAHVASDASLARPRTRVPGIAVRQVSFTFEQLRGWRDALTDDVMSTPGVVWLDLDEVSNRVVIGILSGADDRSLHRLAHERGVPEGAVELRITGSYVPQKTLLDEFRPIEGGTKIQWLDGNVVVDCTLSFAARWNNKDAFLTAGHCSPMAWGTDSVEQFQPLVPLSGADSATMTPIGREVFRYFETLIKFRVANSDAAIYEFMPDTIPPIPAEQWVLGRIAKPSSGCFPSCPNPNLEVDPDQAHWTIVATKSSFVVGDLVSKIGMATGWTQALVHQTCVHMRETSSTEYRCQVLAEYGSAAGDSGAPVILDVSPGDPNIVLGGIHSGRSTSGYAVFSPWSGIVQDYGGLVVF